MTMQGRVESSWHVEVCEQDWTVEDKEEENVRDGVVSTDGCIYDMVYHYVQLRHGRRVHVLKSCWEEDKYLLCGYSDSPSGTERQDSDAACGSGVLVVDCRDGKIVCDAQVPCHWGGSRDDVITLDIKTLEGGIEAMLVTSKGHVWNIHLNVKDDGVSLRSIGYMGNFIDAGKEDSPLEVVVHDAMEPVRHESQEESPAVKEYHGPKFIPELGYRGPMDGYTYWAPTGGEQGYYRDDVMHDMMQKTRTVRAEREEGERTSEDVKGCTLVHKGFIRCLLPLGGMSSSQCIISSRGPEDGVLYLCSYDLIENGPSSFACEKGLVGHASGVLCLAASPDGTFVVSGSYDQTIRVWDTRTWKCLKVLKGHGGGVKCLLFTRDGSLLFSTASDNTIRVWSTSTWMCMRNLHGRHEDATWPVCMDLYEPLGDDGGKPRFLVSGSNGLFGGSTLKLFDIDSGNCLVTFAQLRYDHKGSCTALCIGSKGNTVFTAASDSTIAGWTCSFEKEKKPVLKGGFLC